MAWNIPGHILSAAVANQVLPPLMPGYDPNIKGYDYSVDKAKALLDDAGIDAVCIGTWPYMHREITRGNVRDLVRKGLLEARVGLEALDRVMPPC